MVGAVVPSRQSRAPWREATDSRLRSLAVQGTHIAQLFSSGRPSGYSTVRVGVDRESPDVSAWSDRPRSSGIGTTRSIRRAGESRRRLTSVAPSKRRLPVAARLCRHSLTSAIARCASARRFVATGPDDDKVGRPGLGLQDKQRNRPVNEGHLARRFADVDNGSFRRRDRRDRSSGGDRPAPHDATFRALIVGLSKCRLIEIS